MVYLIGKQRPEAFNDIVMGDNSCTEDPTQCCPYGFPSKVGWDATTGFGTPKFDVWIDILQNLAKN